MPIPTRHTGEAQDAFMHRCMTDEVMVNEYKEKQRIAICMAQAKKGVENVQTIKKVFNFNIKQIGNESDRTLGFTGSTEAVDRDGDVILATGWQLDDYLKNPVIMGFHEYDKFPYAKSTKTYLDYTSKELKFEVKFPTIGELTSFPGNGDMIAEHAKSIDLAYNMYKNGYMNAVSVGFVGLESTPRVHESDGYLGKIYTKCSLLELSLVPVPSNPTALQDAKTKGFISEKELKELQIKAVVPYHKYPLAPETETWDGPAETAKASPEELKIMSTWYDSANEDKKGAYKLPHHKQSGYSTVWRAVAAAMAALLGARGGVQIPEADRKGVYNHLSKHYDDFGKKAPDYKTYSASEIKAMFPELKSFDFANNIGVTKIFEAIEYTIDPTDSESSEVIELYPINYPNGFVMIEQPDGLYLYDYTLNIETMAAILGDAPIPVNQAYLPKSYKKSGASISAKNREALTVIHGHMTNAYKGMKTFLADGVVTPFQGSDPTTTPQVNPEESIKPGSTMPTVQVPGMPMMSPNTMLPKEDGMLQGTPMMPNMSAYRTMIAQEIKSAFNDIKSQIIFLTPKDVSKEIDLDAIEYTPTQKSSTEVELNIEPGALKKMIEDLIDKTLEGVN